MLHKTKGIVISFIKYKETSIIVKIYTEKFGIQTYIENGVRSSKGKNKIGSTLKGIGPTYMDKTGRNALRVGDIYSPKFEEKYNQIVEKHKEMLRRYEGF